MNFLYTSDTFVSYNYPVKEADVLYLGIPFGSTSILKPAIFGHIVVREALKQLSGAYNGVDVFKKFKFCDLGEVNVVPGSYEKTAERIKDTITEIMKENPKIFPIFVGGEHLITLPIVETIKPKTVIQFDAHGDLLPDYEGVKFSHATWAWHASKKSKMIQIGIRDYEEEEQKTIKEHNVYVAKKPEHLDKIKIERPLHLTIDIDVFNMTYVETGFPEGSMTAKEFYAFLEKINPDSMDIVEIADDRLISKTSFLAAEIIKNVLGRKIR